MLLLLPKDLVLSMATQNEKAFDSVSKLNLWFKVTSNQDLKLSDIPELIPYRWTHFRDEWENIRQVYINKTEDYSDPDLFMKHINDMSAFVHSQRNLNTENNPFSNGDVLYKFYTIFDNTSVYELKLTKEESKLIEKAINKVSKYVRKDFVSIRDVVIEARDYLTDIVNHSDDDYNEIYGRNSVSSQLNISNKNLNLLSYFQDSIKSVDFILANIFSLDTMTIDPFALARTNANNPNIDIGTYRSGNLVRFNYGDSLQDIALRELGDSDKWIDIAIANGLKPPYIDEVGERIPLLSNASENQLNISETTDGTLNIDRLFINQVILIKSSTSPFQDQRVIKNIRQAPISGEIIIEVDGDADLDKYKVTDNATIRVFKPNTINSSFLILIPSPVELDDEVKQDVPWFLSGSSESEKRQKIDLMITEDGDLDFTPSEDVQLSFGLENAIQAIKLKLSVETGELEKHSNFGIVSVVGTSTSYYRNIESFLAETIDEAISNDPRFERVERLSVNYFSSKDGNIGSGFDVKLNVRLAGSDSTIPITFSVDM